MKSDYNSIAIGFSLLLPHLPLPLLPLPLLPLPLLPLPLLPLLLIFLLLLLRLIRLFDAAMIECSDWKPPQDPSGFLAVLFIGMRSVTFCFMGFLRMPVGCP